MHFPRFEEARFRMVFLGHRQVDAVGRQIDAIAGAVERHVAPELSARTSIDELMAEAAKAFVEQLLVKLNE